MADDDIDVLAPDVRAAISNLPSSWCTPEQISLIIKKAKVFVDGIKRDDVTNTEIINQCIISLATYWSYVTYLANASNREGTLPEAAPAMIESYKNSAIGFLVQISKVPINKYLIPDFFVEEESEEYVPPVASVAMYSNLS